MYSIQLANITVSFPTRSGKLLALEDINLEIPEGNFVTIIGPSGCGKSTLLNIIAKVVKPTSGNIILNNLDSTSFSQPISFVFQDYVLLPWRTVLKNVQLPLEISGADRNTWDEKSLHYLELVGLTEFINSYPHELSGGMKQRVGIARALVTESPILLMDEPLSALDEITRIHLQLELQQIWLKTKRTVVYVTHNINEAIFLSDWIVILTERPGRVVTSMEIDIPRPRPIEIIASKKFSEISIAVHRHLI